MMLKKFKLTRGFTLTEMMIVVAILGILAVIGIMSFLQQQFKGNDAKRKSDLDTIKIAIEEYEKDNNCYPNPTSMTKCGTDASIAIHPYLNNVPCDPVTDKPYPYETDGSTCADWFRLYSLLQNTKDVTAIPGIGPESIYNFYMSSDNAPIPAGVSSTPYPTAPPGSCTKKYGCINQQCVEVQLDVNCNPVCQPVYDFCFGQCNSPTNPAPECVN